MIHKQTIKFCIIVTVAACSMIVCGVSLADTESFDPSVILKDSSAQKEKIENEINKKIISIKELLDANLFEKSLAQLNELKKSASQLGNSPYARSKRNEIGSLEKSIYKRWSEYLEKKAEGAYSSKEYDKSLVYAQESMDKSNLEDSSRKAAEIIAEKSKSKISLEEFKKVTSPETTNPDYNQDQFDIKKYFLLAEQYKKTHEYEKACETYEKILLLEPYNKKAIFELKQLYRNINQIGRKREYLQMKEQLSQAEWGYTTPIPQRAEEETVNYSTETKKDKLFKIKQKIKNIIIPSVQLEDANIRAVISYLRKESKVYDKDGNEGINIDLRLTNAANGNRTITMNLTDVPIGDVLKYVCVYLGLDYKVESHAVIIGDVALTKMITEYIPIKSDIINSISEVNKLDIQETYDIESSAELNESVDIHIQPITIADQLIKNYFIERGVPFPPNSTIAWEMDSDTLIVKNTQENLKILKDLLHEIDFSPPLIMIETKFVEIDQNKAEGLAFDWKINLAENGNWSINEFTNLDGTEAIGNDPLVRTNIGDVDMASALYQSSYSLGSATGNFKFWFYALEQTGIMETLSAPKIITKSGSTALIEVLEKNWFATSWTVTDPEIVFETVTITPPTPELEEFRLGIIMQVTPTVSPNRKTISMDLYPMVKEFDEWDYGEGAYVYEVFNLGEALYDSTTQTLSNATYTSPLGMPIIQLRDFHTKIKVSDGETVVLGGMIYDRTESVDDSYPFLGDIPLVGRLFRSQFEVVRKYNLLIFVTARLINPDGTLVNPTIEEGAFELRNS